MDHGHLSMVADKFQWVFSEPLLNACGKDVKFCRRQRILTPFRLGLALTATCASQRVETIADLHCGFNALFGTTITDKAFYNQVAKPHFADFARTMTERLISEMTLKVLGFAKGHAFAAFRHIVIQDGMNPQVLDAFREDGKRLHSLRHKSLQTIHAKLPKRQRVALRVQWHVDGAPLCLRLILSWNRRTKRFCSFLTNLSSKRYPIEVICRAYKWRWQVELLFKEWKSYANLHAFDTANPAIVEGLIWTAIAAAALKRFLAYMTQLLAEAPMCTSKVAMSSVHVLGEIVQALHTRG